MSRLGSSTVNTPSRFEVSPVEETIIPISPQVLGEQPQTADVANGVSTETPLKVGVVKTEKGYVLYGDVVQQLDARDEARSEGYDKQATKAEGPTLLALAPKTPDTETEDADYQTMQERIGGLRSKLGKLSLKNLSLRSAIAVQNTVKRGKDWLNNPEHGKRNKLIAAALGGLAIGAAAYLNTKAGHSSSPNEAPMPSGNTGSTAHRAQDVLATKAQSSGLHSNVQPEHITGQLTPTPPHMSKTVAETATTHTGAASAVKPPTHGTHEGVLKAHHTIWGDREAHLRQLHPNWSNDMLQRQVNDQVQHIMQLNHLNASDTTNLPVGYKYKL